MKKAWQKKEKRDARQFGARQTIRSGGLWFLPGDLKNESFLFDSKSTKHKSFTVTKAMWNKIYLEALESQRMPCLSIELGDGTELVILDKNDFLTWFKETK